jgi:hypothetical protein
MEKTRSGKKTEDGWLPPNPERANQMLKQVQHDNRSDSHLFVIPNSVRDLGFGF